ncbi:amino acid ABC transporter permease [Pseudonocardia sp. TRM90224]|uniref:amino acid ABC transporter permease n=1 Tax=Pseudonocardia sp. TRM90224 TaxID=2812678 RepID=UPI001E5CE8D5|nr:amino acid ABC transporter permease [Pseudonocardia sp. TRM90224]
MPSQVAGLSTAEADGDDLVVVARRSPLRAMGMVVVVALAALLVYTLVTNPRFEWAVVARYFTAEAVFEGVLLTLQLTALAMIGGIVLGVILAVMRLSKSVLLSRCAWTYIWFFRGTPLMIQLIFWFNLSALFPGTGVNALITPYVAALLGLTLNEAAYLAEIVRGGLLGVDRGQTEAAQALGIGRGRILLGVVLPQAMRVIVPPTANQTVAMLKNTSLVSVLGVADLLHSAQIIYSRTFQTIPLLIVASLWYLVITTVLGVGQHYVEKYYGRGSDPLAGQEAA